MSTDKPIIIKLVLSFCEPYRAVEWCDRSNRDLYQRYLRGRSFAHWVKNGVDSKGKLRITGTLVRSAVIRAAEELLSLHGGMWGEQCCQGQFTTEGVKPFLLRKRPTINWKSNRECNEKDAACPFCHLLGRFDGAGKNHKRNNYPIEKYFIHFGNMYHDGDLPYYNIKDVASERILNLVDYKTSKAQNYFKVWEVDHEDYPIFTGKITVQPSAYKAIELLKASLGFVDKLCGAMCRIEVVEGNHIGEKGKGMDSGSHLSFDSTQDNAKSDNRKEVFAKSNENTVQLRERVKEIVSAFKGKNIEEKVRILADVVRAMRLKGPDILRNLPKGHDGKNHHLWDVDIGESKLRDILNTLWQNNKDHFTWREFCEWLGNEIYLQYKKKTGGVSVRFRILGDTGYYLKPEKEGQASDFFIPITRTGNVAEWIIVGRLKAATPFYFGVQQSFGSNQNDDARGRDAFAEGLNAEISEQTSFRILLDKEGRYRIPRSLMRGVLRRDLNTAFGGSGCTMDLGGAIPCVCPVCIIMRRITIKNSRSACVEPPDMRYRIRMNPQTATVDEGALFDMEIGTENITFPFVLRYRGEGELPSELWSVLRYWNDGKAWLGGSLSTGKGRLSLEGIKIYQWDLSGEGLRVYIDENGLRGNELEIKDNELPSGLKPPVGLPDDLKIYESYQKYLKPQWQEVTYTMKIAAPLLSADTIAALLDPNNRDSIAYEKRVWNEHEKKTGLVHTIKGETIRGIVRTAVGRIIGDLGSDDHEDYDCTLCTIFGNEHEAGKIRFEDLEVTMKDGDRETAPNCKKIDHVAIDRFTGGAVDKKKFDTYPIAGSPNNPILLEGTFWMKRDLTDKERKLIGDALLDIKQGLYPIGGKTGIGYGWVSDLVVDNPPAYFSDLVAGRGETDAQEAPSEACPRYNKPRPSPELPNGGNDKKFYPHYFLEPDKLAPDKYVKREPFLPELGHEKFNNGLLTGKISCSLKTLTPLIIPDSMYHYDFCEWEFTQSLTVNGLCKAINSAISGLSLEATSDTINRLNELLKVPKLYDITKKADRNFSKDVMGWIDKTKTYRDKDFTILNDDEKCAIKILNRLIIEELFPNETPKSNKHKRYSFFRINDEVMIPGSEIKGTISTIYEAITNSCFRVFEDSKYLSRRISTKQKPKYGMVTNGATSITEIEEVYRLPLYDDEKVTNAIVFNNNPHYINGDELRKRRIQTAFEWNKVIAYIAKENRAFLLNMNSGEREKVLHGEISIKFNLIEGVYPKDCIAILGKSQGTDDFKQFIYKINTELFQFNITVKNGKEREGFLKFTGMNMVNIKKPVNKNNDFQDSWDVESLNILHNKDRWRKSRDHYYPRPELLFVKDKVQYKIPKRCERIFTVPSDTAILYEVPIKVRNQYESILEDYKKNFGHINEKFLTRVQHQELTDGDLVYFFANNDKNNKVVKAVMPVPLSRTTDDKPVGEKLSDKNLLPCDHGHIECTSVSGTENFDTTLSLSHPKYLCPACRLFGNTDYKGRVRFGYSRLKEGTIPKWHKGSAGDCEKHLTLPLLECPRVTWSIPEDNENFKVPGRKFYVHHSGWKKKEENRNENNRSVETLDKDNEFTFDIFFENLEKWELGLLLYGLELEPENNLAHKMGMAKAHGFGSVQIAINKISFRVNPVMYKMANGSRCKNRLIDIGYAQLREWDGTGKEWYDIPRIQKLRKLLKYENESTKKVEYPELEGKDGFPGYTELGNEKNWLYKDRIACLTIPWETWYPYKKAPKDENRSPRKDKKYTPTPSQQEITKAPPKSGDSGVYKRRENLDKNARRTEGKSNISLAKKYHGKVKLIKKDCEIVITKEDGVEIVARDFEKTPLKEGQKVKFRIERGTLYTRIYDIEITL